MDLKEFDYDLPDELIAQYPLKKRDSARLMVIDRRKQTIRHDVFSHIGRYLPEKTLLILNDSKVIPARLLGRREHTGGEVEIFLLKKIDSQGSYQVLMRPMRRLKLYECVHFDNGKIVAQILDKENRIVRFNRKDVERYLHKIGHIPLPPYINRKDTPGDRADYQTVYAQKNGSVASPTAGLHFTEALLNRLKKDGHSIGKVTLHINYATFKQVEEADIRRHPMHEENFAVTKATFDRIKNAKEAGRAIAAVGTTSCRVLETLGQQGRLKGSTRLFIYPEYSFRMTDILITNFHFPFSTLLMLVYAFGGVDLMKKAYQEAIVQKYRFYSYGDAMIIL